MIRLTEARARLELRNQAVKQDALDVVELMKSSLFESASNEFGELEFSRSQHGTGMSRGTDPKKFIAALQRISEQSANSRFTHHELYQTALGKNLISFFSFSF